MDKLEIISQFIEELISKSELDEQSIKEIIDHTISKTVKDEVHCGDIVLVSIDDAWPVEYFIAGKRSQSVSFGTACDGMLRYTHTSIPWDGSLGFALIGAHVGDEVEYLDDTDGTIHSAYIKSTTKTEYSKKTNIGLAEECNEKIGVGNDILMRLGLIENLKDEVYCGDIVSVSIDCAWPEEYFIASNRRQPVPFGTDCDGLHHYAQTSIPWDGPLGSALIGAHVGDEVEYLDDTDSKIHSAYIESTAKTKYSEKMAVEAEIARTFYRHQREMELRDTFEKEHPEHKKLVLQKIAWKQYQDELEAEITVQDSREDYGFKGFYDYDDDFI